MKTIWKGSLTFGLVNIPIRLYSATEQKTLGFKMLCGKCHSPIQYKRWCPHCKKEIPWHDIVKGIKLKNDKFFILTKEKIEELKPEKTDTIDIIEFIEKGMIDPIYFNSHYYAIPGKSGEKAYFLLQKALSSGLKYAIGKFVMREKEYVCAIEAYQKGLLLTTLNYAYEIRDISKIEALTKKIPKIDKKELELANTLINKMTKKKFDISKFKDTFAQTLKKMIKAAEKGKKVTPPKIKKERATTQESLMDALRASI
jgi:DNA end-binding protein Ku